MILLPAIDLKDGACVRLYKGSFDTVEQVAADPLETARAFETAGARWLHMVDLDGAKDGRPQNLETVLAVVSVVSMQVELGGGIRDLDTAERCLSGGVSRVILGSAAVKNPALVRQALAAFGPERVAVGIDARDGMVSVEGWLDSSEVHFLDLAREMEKAGVRTVIFTDIAKDGTLEGPNFEELAQLQQAVGCQVIASGGIAGIGDVAALKKLGVYGAICGKSLYKGTLDLKEALTLAKEESYAG